MNDMQRIAGWSAALLLALATGAGAQTRTGAVVIGSGAAVGANGTVRMAGTLGQTIIGPTGRAGIVANQGFWYTLPPAAPIAASPDEHSATAATLGLRCAPNPFAGSALLRADLPTRGHILLEIYDLLGRPVRTIIDEEREAGPLNVTVAADGLESGRYTAVLTAGGNRTTTQLMVIR
ncbi:MAG: hypothetical protein JWQ98_1322 [Chlorobi bacterium]|nr:hypothetical protein [Chlorobiota bacterium]